MKTLLAILALMAAGISAWGITGAVIDNKGRPVPKAEVRIWSFWTSDRTFHTDAKGEFLYQNVASADGTIRPETYRIIDADGKPAARATVIMPWYNQSPITVFTDNKGQFDYSIPDDTKGLMCILDSAGKPMPGAKASGGASKSAIVTDVKGEYHYEALQNRHEPKKQMSVHITAAGYTYANTYYTVGQAAPLVVKLLPERVLKLEIVGEDGKPVPNAKAILTEVSGGSKTGGNCDSSGADLLPNGVVTGKNGLLDLRHMPGQGIIGSVNIRLIVDATGRARVERQFPLADLAKSGKIVLPRACTLQGKLIPPGTFAAAPLPTDLGLVMSLQEKYGPTAPSERWANVGKDGSFIFNNLPPGTATITLYTIHRRALGWVMPAVTGLPINPGTKSLSIKGVGGGVVSGSVRDKTTGKPIATAELVIQDATNPEGKSLMSDQALTDKQGNYSVRVAPGPVKLYVEFFFLNDKGFTYRGEDRPVISLDVGECDVVSGKDFLVTPPAKPDPPLVLPD